MGYSSGGSSSEAFVFHFLKTWIQTLGCATRIFFFKRQVHTEVTRGEQEGRGQRGENTSLLFVFDHVSNRAFF